TSAEQADAFFPSWSGGQELQSGLAVPGSDEAFDKPIRLGNLLGSACIHIAIEAEHASIGAERIAFVGLSKSFFESCADGRAARIIVFNDHGGRLGELANQI